jgi:hypothetical protein
MGATAYGYQAGESEVNKMVARVLRREGLGNEILGEWNGGIRGSLGGWQGCTWATEAQVGEEGLANCIGVGLRTGWGARKVWQLHRVEMAWD